MKSTIKRGLTVLDAISTTQTVHLCAGRKPIEIVSKG